MMQQMKGLLYFYATNIRYSLIIFWSVLIGSLCMSMILDFILISNSSQMKMIFMIPIAVYVYSGILGFLFVQQTIPFAIKMGATRKSIFASTGLFFLIFSFGMSTIANCIHSPIEILFQKFGNESFLLFHLGQLLTNNFFLNIFIDASIILFLLASFYWMGLIFYKYGLIGGGIFSGLFIVFIIVGLSKGFLLDFFQRIYFTFDESFFGKQLFIAFILYLLTWVFVRKITIYKTR